MKPFRHFARAYVDNIDIFSDTKEDYLWHLEALFRLFEEINMSLSPKKSWLGYPSV